MMKLFIIIVTYAALAGVQSSLAGDAAVELRFDHVLVITNYQVQAACMILTNLSSKAVRYSGSLIGPRGFQVGHLRQKRVADRWEDAIGFVCMYELEPHILEPGAAAQFIFPPTSPPGEWRVGVSLGASNVVWSSSLPPMRGDLEKPNHAVEPTRALSGARGSP